VVRWKSWGKGNICTGGRSVGYKEEGSSHGGIQANCDPGAFCRAKKGEVDVVALGVDVESEANSLIARDEERMRDVGLVRRGAIVVAGREYQRCERKDCDVML
jgi:hypothetical protein